MGNCYACLFCQYPGPNKAQLDQLIYIVTTEQSKVVFIDPRILEYFRRNPKKLRRLLEENNVNVKKSLIYLICLQCQHDKKMKEYKLNKKKQSLLNYNIVKREQNQIIGVVSNDFLEYLFIWNFVLNSNSDFRRHYQRHENNTKNHHNHHEDYNHHHDSSGHRHKHHDNGSHHKHHHYGSITHHGHHGHHDTGHHHSSHHNHHNDYGSTHSHDHSSSHDFSSHDHGSHDFGGHH